MELTEQQKQALKQVGDTHHLRFVILHGSYATGRERPGSDIDIAIVGPPPITAAKHASLYRGLVDVFGDRSDRELDFKSLFHADPMFRYQVTRDGVLLYGDTSAYAEYKLYALRDYMDSADLRRLESRLTRAKQARLEMALARH